MKHSLLPTRALATYCHRVRKLPKALDNSKYRIVLDLGDKLREKFRQSYQKLIKIPTIALLLRDICDRTYAKDKLFQTVYKVLMYF